MSNKINDATADRNRFLNSWHREKSPNIIQEAIREFGIIYLFYLFRME